MCSPLIKHFLSGPIKKLKEQRGSVFILTFAATQAVKVPLPFTQTATFLWRKVTFKYLNTPTGPLEITCSLQLFSDLD